ncbi:MAG: S-layer homology domain-containing protein [Candidatus Saganbacteria bacterium]|nr:S-layer homology domain-containing protein [Candidatus Saganbacteria bacterium]
MGKGFLAMADDVSTIFINPAGLSSFSDWQLTSMSGKFINEFEYINLGVAYPTDFGNFGVGYVGSSIGFYSAAATTETVDGVRIIPSTTEGISYTFGDRVMLFSWGDELERFSNWQILKDISVGATLKLFSLNMAGQGISDGRGSGTEMDLGMLYRPNPVFSGAVVLQNALPYAYGGKITWANGGEETLAAILKLGTSTRLLGKDGWRDFGEHVLSMNLDADFYPNLPALPTLMHFGLEWSPSTYVDIRAGIDQDIVGTGTGDSLSAANNLTMGLGLYFGGFRFDYAYHKYNQVTDNDTHYFSLSYGIFRGKPSKEASFLYIPPDKSILYTDSVTIEGVVLNKTIDLVKINGREATIEESKFSENFPLEKGKNTFLLSGFDAGKLIDNSTIRILHLKDFLDVPQSYWAVVPISSLATLKIINGYPNGTFAPEKNITRAELCVLLMNALSKTEKAAPLKESFKSISISFEEQFGLELVPVSEKTSLAFSDVPTNYWAATSIREAVELGVVKGYPNNTFRPNESVTRAEGVTIIARFAKLPESRLLELPFSDVPGRHWAISEISSAKEAGILEYLVDKPFEPNKKLTRAETAEILSKTSFIADEVDLLLDWGKGY